MKYKFFLFVIFLCTGISIALVTVIRERYSKPQIIKSFKRCDFGIVHPNQKLGCKLDIPNPSREVLKIVDVKNSCGCLTSEVGTRTIPPQSSTTMKLVLKTGYKTGRSQNLTTILAETEGTKQKYQFAFLTTANSQRVINIHNKGYNSIMLGDIKLQDLPVKKTFIISKGKYPLVWDTLRCQASDDNIDTNLEKAGHEKWKLELKLKNTGAIGDFRSHLVFSFLDKGKPQPYQVIKPIDAHIVGPITTSPKSILFGTMHPGETAETCVSVYTSKNIYDQFKILSVDSTDPNQVQTKVLNQNLGKEILITMNAPSEEGIFEGRMIITAQLDKRYKLYVCYLGYVLKHPK